ncbi:uncharacterized protein LOC131205309 [Anopheles bellator]|uniref:uncharacterized protein LOC131205309 n=1 Tax=Anopheles bellator TaxID=139047 RepID=UPI002649128B|nr:uncharacterized protein LOC131205309 [Anopheles bellator]
MTREKYSSLGHDFFRRHPSLRRISTCKTVTPVEWVESICQHCPEITHLKLTIMVYPEEGVWESLVQLSKLKYLSLRASGDVRLFRGAMKSLESVHLQTAPSLRVLGNLFDVGPQLSCLKICHTSYNEIQFICEKFACLRRLELYVDDKELNVSDNISIRSIHRNNVRCLTILGRSDSLDSRSGIMNSDLVWIPEKFPLLNRLIIRDCSVSLAAIERLHHSVPSCRIDYDNKRFYPILDAPAR